MICYLKNLRVIIFTVIIFCQSFNTKSYANSADDYMRPFFYGTYIGLDLGLVNHFEAAPLAGYRIIPRWHAGIGGKYLYYNDKRFGSVFNAHIFGPWAFTDFVAIRDLESFLPFRFIDGALFLHGEVNMFSLPVKHFDTRGDYIGQDRFFRPTWMTGVGLSRQAGHKNYFHVLLMFDVSGHSNKIYSNPVVRFGLMF